MKVTVEEVRRIARLARLRFSPEEEEEMVTELSTILDYMDTLQQVDLEVDEGSDAEDGEAREVFRNDEVGEVLDTDEALKPSKDIAGQFFTVPKVIS